MSDELSPRKGDMYLLWEFPFRTIEYDGEKWVDLGESKTRSND